MGEITIEEVFQRAVMHHRAGELPEAIGWYRRALEMRPGSPSTWNNLSLACKEAGDVAGAEEASRRAVELAPLRAGFWSNRGNLLREMGQLDEAIASYGRALEIEPDAVGAINNLGIALQDSGLVQEAIALFRRGVAVHPEESLVHSNLVYAMHFDPRYNAAEILQEHRIWARRHADHLTTQAGPHANDANPDRKLRIGYMSAYLQDHVVGRFMLPLLEAHDRNHFEVICYAEESGIRTALTERLMAAATGWRPIRGMDDEQVAQWVRDDRIDILVDLGMHMSGSRLLVFARKPAPVQVTYLAYLSTTGVRAIDYRLTDQHIDPPGVGDENYSEKSVRLPGSYWCYRPPEKAQEVAAPTDRERLAVTFGSLNAFSKVTPTTLKTWGRILRQTPGSHLVIHARQGSHRSRAVELLAAEGVAEQRVTFAGFMPMDQYFGLYRLIDIALDPFPYGGGTTTCDAIWAGVPVVTLRGKTAVGRGGASILANVGVGELIAEDTDEYVRIAVGLAGDSRRIAEYRRTLREKMQASAVMDERGFARSMENAYRKMWREWCDRSSLGPNPNLNP